MVLLVLCWLVFKRSPSELLLYKTWDTTVTELLAKGTAVVTQIPPLELGSATSCSVQSSRSQNKEVRRFNNSCGWLLPQTWVSHCTQVEIVTCTSPAVVAALLYPAPSVVIMIILTFHWCAFFFLCWMSILIRCVITHYLSPNVL